jgi:putative N6-adenine-specific DNA methylase
MMIVTALCAIGVEKVLSNELKKLKLSVLESGFGKVRFKAETADLYRALMGLRTADRVLLETNVFSAENFDDLFEGTKSIAWENFIPENMGIRIAKVRINRSTLNSETSVQSVVHKAIADRLCEHYHLTRLSEKSDEGKTAELRVYIEKNTVSILLDLSGDPLFKRAYRSEGGIAPLRETVAIAILLLAGWKRKYPLYDPFCGSGTIAIEAAMYAWDMPPCIGRTFFLSSLLIGSKDLEEEIRKELFGKIDFSRTIRIYGSDSSARTVSIAKSNAERAYELARAIPISERGVRSSISLPWLPNFRVSSMKETSAPDPEGYLISNPPYGKRLGDNESAENTYKEMEVLREHFPKWKMGIITDHAGFESFFGKRADSCREITDGAIKSYFFTFDPSV